MIKKKVKKQATMNMFLNSVVPPQEEPWACPPEGIQEEGLVIVADDSSTCVTVPEDLPVGQDVETVTLMILTLGRPRLM